MAEPIYLETGRKWSFAGAIEWPGWCRHAKGDVDPIAELVAYGARYREALALEGIDLDPPSDLEVVEELTGNSGWEIEDRRLDEPEA